MEEEKKPKRPRIGSGILARTTDNADNSNETRYEKVNYQPSDANHQSSPRQYDNYGEQRQYQRPRQSYDNYNGGYRQNNRQQGGYQPRQQGGYNNNYQRRPYSPRPYDNKEGAENSGEHLNASHKDGDVQNRQGYQPRQQGGYHSNQGGYQNRQGGYNNRQGGYQQNRRGYNNYQPRYNDGGYNRYNDNASDEQSQQGGYQNRQGYQPRQQNGYRPNQGYQQNRQGGYRQNNNNRPGAQNRPGGYQQNRQGGYQQRQQRPGMRFTPRPKQIDYVLDDIDPNEPIRLNKFMANAGVCSRRDADEFITSGRVKVNGETVTELGVKISRSDIVEFDDKVVTPERKCYVLLNKPKDCVTTIDDPNGRLTVLDIVKNACKERIYPVGRLDRNTTGVLLLTNDGDLASKLTHPKFVKKKIYHVWTDKDIAEEDMQRIADGIELDDGEIHADAISYVNDTDKNQAGIEIHSGRNRIVRRIFESLGYRVTKLDRVYFAGLTKKNLPRGKWRFLTQDEVNYLRKGTFE